ncbi:MAG: hypothetical protein HY735_31250 [Verrucomicrobia bacterium]|nr:hypothetical protein [Verrucomicrobiota bacterium]
MSTVTLEDARRDFSRLFDRVLQGETIIIENADQRVALHALTPAAGGSETAPCGYFAEDYSTEEIAELNQLAAQGPLRLVP